MSYLNPVWMGTSVAVVQGHTDQGHNWKIGIKSLQHGNGAWIGVRRAVRWRIGRDGKGNVGEVGWRHGGLEEDLLALWSYIKEFVKRE
uniref:Uncharacterized protein n=1 Tax=Quercus lobata TaxID=97700 RepID=A0A7N2QZ45_QUELO